MNRIPRGMAPFLLSFTWLIAPVSVDTATGKPIAFPSEDVRKPSASAAKASGAMAEPAPSLQPARETRTLSGWTVHVSRDLLKTNAEASGLALNLLAAQLEYVVSIVPSTALQELQKVPLWISPEYPATPPRAEYHPNAGWLRAHGRDPSMAKGIEFTNVRIFELETKRMPVFALHELAHAYHDRALGNDHPALKEAYEQAKTSGRYDRVERRDARGRVSIGRAYAMTNPQEYFAETSEAFFGTNDFFPFTCAELRHHDPGMFKLLGKLWGTGAEPVPPSPPSSTLSK